MHVTLCKITTNPFDYRTMDGYVIFDGQPIHCNRDSSISIPVKYALPKGFTVGRTVAGETAIFDENNKYCSLSISKDGLPEIRTKKGYVTLQTI